MRICGNSGLSSRSRLSFRWLIATCSFALLSLSLSCTASAVEITIPLNINYITLTEALRHKAYDGPAGRAELWVGSDKCQYFYAYRPRFEREDGALVLGTDIDLSLGVSVAGKCVIPITWSGVIEFETQPYIGNDLAIKFHVVNINLFNSAHEKSVLLRGFDLIKSHFVPRIEDFSYDLHPPLDQLENLMQAAAAPEIAERVKTAFSTMRPMSAVIPGDDGLKLTLRLDVPEIATPMQSVVPAPLSPSEIAAWQTMLDDWDAFIVFAIKQLAGTVGDKQFRAQLFDLLLDSRYRLVQALAQPQVSTGPDPIRLIFIDEWSRLRAIIQAAARREILGSRVLEFLSFVSAGDALFAADQAAPALGMRISEDDLRQLAHIMTPQYAGDPLIFSYDTDPQLQRLFGFTEPLESPGPLDAPVPDTTPAATVTPAAPLISPRPPTSAAPDRPSPSPVSSSTSPSTLDSTIGPATTHAWCRWFAPRDAHASEDPSTTQIFNLGAALKRAVVEEDNVTAYAQSIQRLLTLIAQREIAGQDLAPQRQQAFLALVKSTAWQESCWRQFIRIDGRVRFLESDTADVGLMQVNKHVWRGFYSIPRLEWDIAYNAGAGAEILMRLMSADAALVTTKDSNSGAEIARSTYAAYNGGPGAYSRWRRSDESGGIRYIDQSFWTKFRAVTAGQLPDILSCATQGRASVAAQAPHARPTASSK
jgi:Transglycosylase SLT domain